MKYMIEPPKYHEIHTNVPKFVFKHHFLRFVRKMIDWSTREYFEAIGHYSNVGDWKTVRLLNTSVTEQYVLSKHPCFQWICEVFLNDEQLWMALSKYEARFISKAYKYYQR